MAKCTVLIRGTFVEEIQVEVRSLDSEEAQKKALDKIHKKYKGKIISPFVENWEFDLGMLGR